MRLHIGLPGTLLWAMKAQHIAQVQVTRPLDPGSHTTLAGSMAFKGFPLSRHIPLNSHANLVARVILHIYHQRRTIEAA